MTGLSWLVRRIEFVGRNENVDNCETRARKKHAVVRAETRRNFSLGGLGRQLDDIGPPPGQNWIVSRKWTLQQRASTLQFVE